MKFTKGTSKIKEKEDTVKNTVNNFSSSKRKLSFEEQDYIKRKAAHEKREKTFKFSKYEAIINFLKSIYWLIKIAILSIAKEFKFNKISCCLFLIEVGLIPLGIDIMASILIPGFEKIHYYILGVFLCLISQVLQYTFIVYRTIVVLLGTGFYSFVILYFSNDFINNIYDRLTIVSVIEHGSTSGVFHDVGLNIEIKTVWIIVFLVLWLILFLIQNRIRRYHPIYKKSELFKNTVVYEFKNLKEAFSQTQNKEHYE